MVQLSSGSNFHSDLCFLWLIVVALRKGIEMLCGCGLSSSFLWRSTPAHLVAAALIADEWRLAKPSGGPYLTLAASKANFKARLGCSGPCPFEFGEGWRYHHLSAGLMCPEDPPRVTVLGSRSPFVSASLIFLPVYSFCAHPQPDLLSTVFDSFLEFQVIEKLTLASCFPSLLPLHGDNTGCCP